MIPAFEATLDQVERIVCDFWASAPGNTLHLESNEKAWAEPHIAVARGDDPFFAMFKEMIGPFYWTPEEVFSLAFPALDATPSELRVISYVLPQTTATRADQREEKIFPAERWTRSRFHGEQFNRALRLHLSAAITEAGFPAVAPERLPNYDYRQSERFGIVSNWSERHAAFVAGLGTFGLSDGLITRWGKAVRFGSVVARIQLPVTRRPYGEDHHAWCLRYAKGICGACARRCPADAITTARGHDKEACRSYIREVAAPKATAKFGTDASPCLPGVYPCGLCQVGIPCEAQIPPSLRSNLEAAGGG